MTLNQTVASLRALQRRTLKQIEKYKRQVQQLEVAVNALSNSNHNTNHRVLSKDARRRISEAQKLRWAKTKRRNKVIELRKRA